MPDLAVRQVPIHGIRPSPSNPRIFPKSDAKNPELQSLAQSIREKGLLQPVLVRPLGDGGHMLVAGERRFRASKLAGLEAIPAIVREDLTDQEALELTVTENLQREDLHPLEEAKGVAALLDSGQDLEAVADRLGKPRSWVARRARLSTLSPKWRKRAADPRSEVSEWPATMLELVARLEPAAQDEFLESRRWLPRDATELRGHLAGYTMELRLAPWKLDDELLDPKAGACNVCPKRSSCNPGLFDDEIEPKKAAAGDRCLDATCWDRKLDATIEAKAAELEAKHGQVVFTGEAHHDPPKFVKDRGATMVDRWQGNSAKKSDPGAVPVLHVRGHDRGRVEWRTFGKASAAAKKAAGKSSPSTLAERRAKLENRRRAHALHATVEAVEKSEIPHIDTLVRLASAFGTESNAQRTADGTGYDSLTHEWVTFTTLLSKAKYQDRLHRSVVRVIGDRWKGVLSFRGQAGLASIEEEISIVCKLLGVDRSPFAAAAAEAIPEPKSWAKLEAAEKAERSAKRKAAKKAAPTTKKKPAKKAARAKARPRKARTTKKARGGAA